MLVIVSDLHLSDGSNGVGLDPGMFEMFAQRIADLAMRASWRGDGRYRPIDRIDLVLLGDTLDLIRSRRWLESETRPWSDCTSARFAETVGRIVDDVLHHNVAALRTLRALAVEGALRLPPAGTNGRPLVATEGLAVPVVTHYMVGESDWPLHVRGGAMDLVRRRVCHSLGLINEYKRRFPHDPSEATELQEALRRHQAFARHGDVFDPLACGQDREGASIGDALSLDLIQRFLVETSRMELPSGLQAAIRELDHFRPLTQAATYLNGALERLLPNASARKQLRKTWDGLLDETLALPLVRENAAVGIDALATAFSLTKRTGSSIAASDTSLARHALNEAEFRNRRAQHIVYGYTHQAEIVSLDASYADGFVLPQTYFNAGSWRRVYRPVRSISGRSEYLADDAFTLLTFFQGDERGGRPYETWTGSLGVCGEATTSSDAIDTPIATNIPLRAPHFALPSTISSMTRS